MSDAVSGTIFDQLDQVFGSSGYRRTMGLRILRAPESDPHAAIVECEVSMPYANTQGVAHGGLISGLIDTAAGIAVKLAAGDAQLPVATVSLTINYHRPGQVGRTLRAVGRRISGSRTPCCAVEVHDDHGTHVASGLVTLRARVGATQPNKSVEV
jgi:uncharacterized protein (TIGR00369 family)